MAKKNSIAGSLFNFLTLIAAQRHLVALRDGMIASIPIILVGSTFLLLGSQKDVLINYLPWLASSNFGKWYIENYTNILIPFRFTMGMLSLYVTFSISASLATQYKIPVLPNAMGAVVAFLLTLRLYVLVPPAGDKAVLMMPIAQLGGEGLFLAIVCSILSVELSFRISLLYNKIFQSAKELQQVLPQDSEKDKDDAAAIAIPGAVAEAFISFLPIFIVIFIVWLITYTFHIDVYSGLIAVLKPLEKMGDTVWCAVIVNFFMHLFGFAGLHGISVINGVFFALWQKFLLLNTEAHMSDPGSILPKITAYPFYQWFVWIGGQGSTLPVPFMLLFFKNAHMKRIGKLSLIPSLFNINEPLLFGLPVVANPILFIPFVIAPVACAVVSFLAFEFNILTRPFIEVPWVLPAILGAPLSTQSIRGLILLLINVSISAFIWWPFLKVYEKRIKN